MIKTNSIRWQLLFVEGKDLAQLAHRLTEELRPNQSKNIFGSPEWEYNSREWYRNVLPAINGAPGIVLQNRLQHFAVEVRSFLKDMQALRDKATACPVNYKEGQIFYDGWAISKSWDYSWKVFLDDYETIRKTFSKADLECEDADCGDFDEISLPYLPVLQPYWSEAACETNTVSIFDDGSR